jgi:diguanylate cyclase (GGDEF)-like protein
LFHNQKWGVGVRNSLTQFIRSKSGLALSLYLAFAVIVSAGVAYQFYNFSLDKFRSQKAAEKTTALRLVDAFVTTYATFSSQLAPDSPVPSTFRAHSIESFNAQAGASGKFLLRWVGRPGRYIATPPSDSEMARTIEAFVAQADPKPVSALSTINGRLVFRTVYPSLAREQSCVTCHNRLQPGSAWKLNDVMGAFAIDVPVGGFLEENRKQSYQVGLGLFVVLTAVGLAIAVLHFRQTNEREAAAAELGTQNLLLDTALKNMSQGLCMFDREQRLVIANARYAEMYGLTPEQVKPGTTLRQILEYRIAIGAYTGSPQDYINERIETASGNLASSRTYALADGRVFAIAHKPMADGGWVATHEDITEQRRYEAKIAHMALHDGLTDLPNRTLLNERLEQALARARPGEIVAIHLLDLDRFKNVNDTLGHAVGDKLLNAIAGRLRALVKETDTVARMGGDEFAIVQAAINDPADAAMLAARIMDAIAQPYDIDGHHVTVATSIGIAVGRADGVDASQLIRDADLALYRSKSEGRGTFRFFEPGMDVQMQARRALERDLRNALSSGQLELHFQPFLNLARNDITGVEALIRWRHPERGVVQPGNFIPLLEETGLITEVGRWVLTESCRQGAEWIAAGHGISMAVNVSGRQLDSDQLIDDIRDALDSSGMQAQALTIEITETTLMRDVEQTARRLGAIKDLGVRIAIDDFGTGYSSLAHLQRFPVDALKIDRSFVSGLSRNKEGETLIQTLVQLGKALSIETFAEGIEEQHELSLLKSEDCDSGQGFYFARPLEPAAAEAFFRSWAEAAAPAIGPAPATPGP